MNTTSANFLAIVGFLLAFGGVGGLENSITDTELMQSLIVAIVGLSLMGCGVLAMNVLDSREL